MIMTMTMTMTEKQDTYPLLKRAKPAKNGTEERILTLRCQQKST